MAIEFLSNMLFMCHTSLATVMKMDRLAIDLTEAEMLANATNKVLRHYPHIPLLSEKSQDWAGLIMTIGTVYGTRIVAASREKKPRDPVQSRPSPSTMQQRSEPMTAETHVPGLGKVEVPLQ